MLCYVEYHVSGRVQIDRFNNLSDAADMVYELMADINCDYIEVWGAGSPPCYWVQLATYDRSGGAKLWENSERPMWRKFSDAIDKASR